MSNDKEISVIGKSGSKINPELLKKGLNKSALNSKELIKLFDFYNTNGDDKLDEDELSKMFDDISLSANNSARIEDEEVLKKYADELKEKDKLLEPDEIQMFLKDKKLDQTVNIADVVNFLSKITVSEKVESLHDDIGAFTTKGRTLDDIKNIPAESMSDVLTAYKKEYKMSMLQHIGVKNGAFGSTREKYMNAVRDKLVEQAKLLDVPSDDFVTQFDAEVKKMDMSILSKADCKDLDGIVDKFVQKLSKSQELYNTNKNGVLTIMANKELCQTTSDKNELLNKIMYYSSKLDTKQMIEKLANSKKAKPAIKKMAQQLLNSKYLDYFPIFIASLMAQESHFEENAENVFSKNGKGVMQITKSIVNDMYEHSDMYDDEFIKYIKKKYPNKDDLYDTLAHNKDSELNIYVGVAGMKGKLLRALYKINNGEYPPGIKTNSPEAMMELAVLDYNGNKELSTDLQNDKLKAETRYIYSRNIMQNFKRYTPNGVKVVHYFEFNPKTNKFVNH